MGAVPSGYAPGRSYSEYPIAGGGFVPESIANVGITADVRSAWRNFTETGIGSGGSGARKEYVRAGTTFRPHQRLGQTRISLDGLRDEALKIAIRHNGSDHLALSYTGARYALFAILDNDTGVVTGVYTGRDVQTRGIPDADSNEKMNTEHTWPRSRGVKNTPANSDLHHLFPTDTDANSQRSNLPFGEVIEVQWQEGESKLGLDKDGEEVFEPPDGHKGNVARALFYVSSVYGLPIDPAEEAVLRRWHRADPVDGRERSRNSAIADVQGNRNPFIDDPRLVRRIADF